MGLKTKLAMAVAASAAGAAMIAGGTFAIFTAEAHTQQETVKAGTVSLDITGTQDLGPQTANAFTITNIAPGDTLTKQVYVTNSGSLDQFVKIDTAVKGSIFNNNGVTGSNADGTQGPNLTSIDYAATNNSPDFQYDDNPMWYQATVSVEKPNGSSGWVADSNVTGVPQITKQSTSSTSSVFKLPSGDRINIQYTLRLPIDAHNDYQNANGTFQIQVDGAQQRNTDGTKMNPDLNDINPDGSASSTGTDQFKNDPLN